MRIACPSCHAEYEVPDAMLAAGARQLRCARCGHGFAAALPRSAPAVPPLPTPPLPTSPLAGTVAALPEPGQPAPAPAPAPLSDPPATDPPARPPLANAPSATGGVPVPAPPEPLPVTVPVTAPERPPPARGPMRHSPIDAPEDPPPSATGRLAAAWLGSLALVGAGVAALLVFHAEIAAAWPPAARLYAALGLG